MVHEYAGQLVADRLMDQHGSHRAVDAAAKAANDLAVAHLRADVGDLGGAEFGHRPVARQPADMAHEVGDQLGAVRRVHHLGVELRAIIAALVIGDQREGRALGGRDDTKARRKFGHLVAMAHPHLMPFTDLP